MNEEEIVQEQHTGLSTATNNENNVQQPPPQEMKLSESQADQTAAGEGGAETTKPSPLPTITRSIAIPSSLRSVAPFLEEAQAHAGYASSSLPSLPPHLPRGKNLDDSRRRVSISCIDHAFRLLNTVEFQVDDNAKKTLNEFTELRNALLETMDVPDEKLAGSAPMVPGSGDEQSKVKKEKTSPEQLLIAEANATLDLAESQLEEGMNEAAARNFHTATVYFRVLESIVPHMSTELHARLQYSASRTRQCSHLLQNFVHEHFEGFLFFPLHL